MQPPTKRQRASKTPPFKHQSKYFSFSIPSGCPTEKCVDCKYVYDTIFVHEEPKGFKRLAVADHKDIDGWTVILEYKSRHWISTANYFNYVSNKVNLRESLVWGKQKCVKAFKDAIDMESTIEFNDWDKEGSLDEFLGIVAHEEKKIQSLEDFKLTPSQELEYAIMQELKRGVTIKQLYAHKNPAVKYFAMNNYAKLRKWARLCATHFVISSDADSK